jgi:hypothetical protein
MMVYILSFCILHLSIIIYHVTCINPKFEYITVLLRPVITITSLLAPAPDGANWFLFHFENNMLVKMM